MPVGQHASLVADPALERREKRMASIMPVSGKKTRRLGNNRRLSELTSRAERAVRDAEQLAMSRKPVEIVPLVASLPTTILPVRR